MQRKNLIWVGACLLLGMFGVALYFPATALPTHSDFSAIYNTDLALVRRVPIYDLAAVRELVQPLSGVPDANFFLARFPYPPWYALSTFYLGLLPPASAATLWFEINLLLLFLSVYFLTDGWPGRVRLLAFPFALLFLPTLGVLSVGQYDLPVLLGTALILFGLKRENLIGVVGGALLVTFKPHIGGLIFIALFIWLFIQKNHFGRQGIKYILFALLALCVLGFLADPDWIRGYFNLLLNYQGEGNVASCSECINPSILISRWFLGGSFRSAVWIALSLLLVCVGFYFLKRDRFLSSPVVFITAGVLAVLWISPYFYNYDFILLLIPLAFVTEHKPSKLTAALLLLCLLVPYFAIGLYGRAGNIALIFLTFAVSLMFYFQIKALTTRPPAHTMHATK